MFQFIGQSIENAETSNEEQTQENKIPYANVLKWIVPVHFVLVLLIISAKAFTIIPFKEMNIILALVEASFGGYTGYIISALFKTKTTEE